MEAEYDMQPGSIPTTRDIVTDPFLHAVLNAAEETKQQCLLLLDLLDRTSPNDKDGALEIARQKKMLYSHLTVVRNMNRRAILEVRQTKQKTAEARHEVDTLHLQLQNLNYEQQHLKGEIAACEDFPHQYQQLNMIPVDEFLEEFPEHAVHVSDDEEQDDALMEARIAHEHAERQALEERRQALIKRKQALILENKKRKEDLANLDKDLEKFIDAAKPIMETFKKEY